jgi:hypothetical protein
MNPFTAVVNNVIYESIIKVNTQIENYSFIWIYISAPIAACILSGLLKLLGNKLIRSTSEEKDVDYAYNNEFANLQDKIIIMTDTESPGHESYFEA